MAARRKRSSKRSATKPTGRPEPPLTCIVDECLGWYAVLEALRAAGLTVVLHSDIFPSGTDDEEWLRELAGWADAIVLTKDGRIRKRPNERQALETAKLKVFALSAAGLSGELQAQAFVKGLPKIRKLAQYRPGPFIARVTAAGSVDLV